MTQVQLWLGLRKQNAQSPFQWVDGLPACRRLLFPLLHVEKKKKIPFPRATKEIGDVCTQASGWSILKWKLHQLVTRGTEQPSWPRAVH